MQKECFVTINKLRKNTDIVTKQDKELGMVILSKCDYIKKMKNISADPMKLKRKGPASSCNNHSDIESRLQKRLLELFSAYLLPENVYRLICPTGSQRSRMYGFLKLINQQCLRPIHSISDSVHRALSK